MNITLLVYCSYFYDEIKKKQRKKECFFKYLIKRNDYFFQGHYNYLKKSS